MPPKKDKDTPAGPRAPKRYVWLDVPEYPEFKVRVWSNHPQRLAIELNSGESERVIAALKEVVVAHNGWCDYDGDPYPDASAEDFWEVIPTELAIVVLRIINRAVLDLPNSLSATRAR